MKKEVNPVAQHPRRVPFSLRETVERKLHELEQMDIIEKVKGPTPWVSPIVVVPKPSGEIRLCIDMHRANEAVVRERHPIPTVDEVLQDMTQSSVFTKLDLKWGYHQLELSEESRGITTFMTHAGLYRYKRLMFGITSAPEIYQHAIQQAVHGCEGVRNISDDIILHAKDDQQHDERLDKLLERLQQRGLTLNPEKCKFRMTQLEFMEYLLSTRGIGPTESKVEAVVNAREPESAAEVRSFMGLVKFIVKFIPNMATVAEPLRQLTWKGVAFKWGGEQKEAFKALKETLASADNLRGACESNLKEGDKVLLQKPKSDKLSSSFETTPYEVVNKQGTQVEIKSPAGVHYKRNVTHLQKFEEDKSQETMANNPKGTLPKDPEASQEDEQRVSTQHYALRPRRNRQPERIKDYELG